LIRLLPFVIALLAALEGYSFSSLFAASGERLTTRRSLHGRRIQLLNVQTGTDKFTVHLPAARLTHLPLLDLNYVCGHGVTLRRAP
jgi:hypothetical protein